MVRLPEGMRATLKAAAKENNRTINSEIVSRLERSFEEEATSDARSKLAAERLLRMNLTGQPDPMEEIDALKRRVADLEKRLSELGKPLAVKDAPSEGGSRALLRNAKQKE